MKFWIPTPDDWGVWLRVVLHRVGGLLARLLLFGSVFLMHPGERCAYESGWPPAPSADVPSEMARQSATEAAPAPDDAPLKF